MSHIQTSQNLSAECKSTSMCEEYRAFVSSEFRAYDIDTRAQINQIIVTSILLEIVVLLLLVASFMPKLKRIASKIFSILITLLPIIVLLAIFALIGFGISFSACFKKECSALAGSAAITLPIISLFLSIPISRIISKKRKIMANKIESVSTKTWIAICLVLAVLVANYTYSSIRLEYRNNTQQKELLTKPAQDDN